MASTNNGPAKPIRCAIYTRKSTEEGLNQDFNSLDAQHDAAEAYIRSQAGEGWTCAPAQYDVSFRQGCVRPLKSGFLFG